MEQENKQNMTLRLGVIFGAILVIVLVVLFTRNNQPLLQDNDKNISVSETEESFNPDSFSLDSDGDGLLDWEESLWGTDKYNPDTDGDGTLDGDEVRLGRDPLVPGPDDSLDPETTPVYMKDTAELSTVTERFEKEYFEGIQELSRRGELNNETLQEFIFGLTNKYIANERISLVYSDSDLSISPDPSSETVRTYTNNLAVAVQGYLGVNLERDLSAMQAYIEDTNVATEAEIDRLIDFYSSAETLLNQSQNIPFVLKDQHLKFLNGVRAMRDALVELKANNESDPLKGVIYLSLYQQGALLLVQGSMEFVDYIKARDISFNSSEPGYSLVN